MTKFQAYFSIRSRPPTHLSYSIPYALYFKLVSVCTCEHQGKDMHVMCQLKAVSATAPCVMRGNASVADKGQPGTREQWHLRTCAPSVNSGGLPRACRQPLHVLWRSSRQGSRLLRMASRKRQCTCSWWHTGSPSATESHETRGTGAQKREEGSGWPRVSVRRTPKQPGSLVWLTAASPRSDVLTANGGLPRRRALACIG
jgi:hypothetical protein